MSTSNSSRFVTRCQIFGENFPHFPTMTSVEYRVSHIMNITFNIVLLFSTVCLNLITMLTIWGSAKLKKTLCFFLVMLQSMSDLTVGLCSIPLSTYVVLSEISPLPRSCVLGAVEIKTFVLLQGTSIYLYLAMTYERWDHIIIV